MTLRRMLAQSNDPTSAVIFMDDVTGQIVTGTAGAGATTPVAQTILSDPTAAVSSQSINASGAINIKAGTVYITSASVLAITLAAPKPGPVSQGNDDGRPLLIINVSGVAHVITAPANTFNGSLHILTLSAAVGVSSLVAQGGKWFVTVAGGTLT